MSVPRLLRGCRHCRGEWSFITRLWRPVCCIWCRREWFGWMIDDEDWASRELSGGRSVVDLIREDRDGTG